MHEVQPRIRIAMSHDMEAIAKIFNHYVTTSVATFEETLQTSEVWHQRLLDITNKGLPFLIAETGGAVVGFAYANPWRAKPAYRYTVEDTVYVDPKWVGRGLGKMLLTTLVERCKDLGLHQMIAVIADTGLQSSQALHSALGFKPVGRLENVGFKHGRWVDTFLMQRSLQFVSESTTAPNAKGLA